MSSEQITVFGGGSPDIDQALLFIEEFEYSQMPCLRVCPGGGAPFPVAIYIICQEKTGIPIYEGHGITEIVPLR